MNSHEVIVTALLPVPATNTVPILCSHHQHCPHPLFPSPLRREISSWGIRESPGGLTELSELPTWKWWHPKALFLAGGKALLCCPLMLTALNSLTDGEI